MAPSSSDVDIITSNMVDVIIPVRQGPRGGGWGDEAVEPHHLAPGVQVLDQGGEGGI